MDMKLVTGITQTNKAGRQYKAKQTLVNDRPVLSSERAPYIIKPVTIWK
jgi:hypothetical protein